MTSIGISPRIMPYVRAAVCDYFSSSLDNFEIKPLAGGYGTAANMQLEMAGKAYALRVLSNLESPLKRNTELHAMKEAAAFGAAPVIHWISPDGCAILMDYIAGGTLTLEQGKNPAIAFKAARLMLKVHAIQKNPFHSPSFESQMEEFYELCAKQDTNQAIWEEAISIIQEGASELQRLNAPRVNTHGDLNPRNILISDQGLYFIDWGDGIYTDPFHDLSFFSIMMDYDAQEEVSFMSHYLAHPPTANERKRFQIAKKMNFARLVLSGQGIGNQLSSKKNENHAFEPLQKWSYYARAFANPNTPVSAQFFWEIAQVALECANALDAGKID